MFNFVIIYNVILVLNVFLVDAQISDKRLCANEQCTEPISRAKTLMRYGSLDSRILSFSQNEEVLVFSKSAGSRADLWGVEIKGQRGYVPKTHLREYKIITSSVKYLVDTEENITNSPPQVPSATELINEIPSPDPVKKPYEVVDGTTIYLNSEDPQKTNVETPSNNLSHQQTEPLKEASGSDKPLVDVQGNTDTLDNKQEDISENPEGKESLVNNVLSSIKNWIEEGSGSENNEEGEDDDDDDEEDDMEVEEEDDEDEKDTNLNLQQKEQGSEELKIKENVGGNEEVTEEIPLNNDELVQDEQVLPDATKDEKENNVEEVAPTEEPKPIVKDILEEQKIEKLEPIKIQPLFQEPVLISNQPVVDNVQVPVDVLKNADVHDHYMTTTEEPNYEIPPPIEEVTLNPVETTLPPIFHNIQRGEALPDNIIKAEEPKENHNDTEKDNQIHTITEKTNSERLEEIVLPKEPEFTAMFSESFEKGPETPEEEQNQGVKAESANNNEQLNNIQVIQTEAKEKEEIQLDLEAHPSSNEHSENLASFNQPMEDLEKPQETEPSEASTRVVESPESSEINPIEVPPVSEAEELENIPKEGQTEDPSLPAEDQTEDPSLQGEDQTKPPPGMFSGIYSSVFGSSDAENISTDTENKEEINVQAEATTDNNETTEEPTEITDEPTKVTEETNTITDGSAVPDEASQESEDLAENKTPDAGEPSARDILWGSSIRKDIDDKIAKHHHNFDALLSQSHQDEFSCAADPSLSDCLTQHENASPEDPVEAAAQNILTLDFSPVTYEILTVLVITAVTVVVFLWGYIYIDKSRKEAPLIAKINNLEKQFLVTQKENEILAEKLGIVECDTSDHYETVPSEQMQSLKDELLDAQKTCTAFEEQIQNLEKELENSTEVGLELNRMLTDLLSSESGSDTLIANVEQLQRQLIEQQGTINTYNENLSIKETENHELRLELEISNTKVRDLQSELDKMALNLLRIEEEKEQAQNSYEADISLLKENVERNSISLKNDSTRLAGDLKIFKQKYEEAQRDLDVKTNEFKLLKENLHHVDKGKKNSETLKSLFDTSSIKAELLQLRKEKELLADHLQQQEVVKGAFEKQAQGALQEAQVLKTKYDEADREKLEAQTKLEVLSNYFKEREAQLQKELNKQESMWVEKQGEATSTIERIKYMQEEMQNYKAQNESLKQEIVAQEVQMKSQISVLEKRAHENWVAARQAERKLEDAKHEASQLRNRITLRERNLNDEKSQNRLQSPLEQNGEIQVSPMHITNDTAASPPLLFGARDHLTTSPAITGLPPFLPPPPGVPFLPPPLGGVPMPPPGFLPPPPSLHPGDHRLPPLGRMSSPPLNSRFASDTRAYSPYSRNSPSPTSDDDYGRSSPPPHIYRGYSPYSMGDDRRDFHRPPPPPIRGSTRNNKGVAHSSGSANSNESLEKINRHNSKV